MAWPGERGFVGGTIDSSTGLTHLGAREYDPTIGRFISVDPILQTADPQQLQGYAYAHNNPITWSDPSGLIIHDQCPDGVCTGGGIGAHQNAPATSNPAWSSTRPTRATTRPASGWASGTAAAGVPFFVGNDHTWLADSVPPEFIVAP